MKDDRKYLQDMLLWLTFATASLIRSAPAELPQDRNVARVGG